MTLSVIILTHNEERMLPECLESVSWADEIVVVDKRSTDRTVAIAKAHHAKIVAFTGDHFDDWRNLGMYHATRDWILYIDPDERVTPALKTLIMQAAKTQVKSAYRMPRKNFWWGQEFRHCGAWPDYVTRLFDKSKLIEWKGIIHESPSVRGETGTLAEPLVHYSHRDLVSGLRKSYQWTQMEAQLFYEAGHPKVTWWRLAKVVKMAFLRKYLLEKGFLEGTAGFIESFVQAFNRFMVYVQLWEMQKEQDK